MEMVLNLSEVKLSIDSIGIGGNGMSGNGISGNGISGNGFEPINDVLLSEIEKELLNTL